MKARPWHLLRKERTPKAEAEKRMAICEQCPHYNKKTTQCGICGCFMPLKTKLPHAECPLGKWTATAPQPNINRKDGGGAI